MSNKSKKSPFLFHREAFIPITNGYIVIPLKELDLDLACENNIKQEKISEPSLLLGNNSKLHINYESLYLGNTIKYNTFDYFNVTYDVQYSASDLPSLENRLIQLPKIIVNVKLQKARLSLYDSENMLNSIVQVFGNSPFFLTLGSKKGERIHNELECGMMTMCPQKARYGYIKQIHNITVVKDIYSKGGPSFRRFSLHYD